MQNIFFKGQKRVVYTGNPVRPDVLVDTREDGRNYFNLSDDTFTVLIAGGSRGARTINMLCMMYISIFKEQKELN